MTVDNGHNGELIIRDQDEIVSRAARQILHAGLGEGRSYFDPNVTAWSQASVDDLYRRYNEKPDVGSDKFLVKLERQLQDAPDATKLLAAELMTLQALPVEGMTQGAKLDRINTVLGWMDSAATIPDDVADAFSTGSWRGGAGAHMLVWKWLADGVTFVRSWWALAVDVRTRALTDPWVWRDVVRGNDLMPSLVEALLFEMFPRHFLNIINTQHKQRIRDGFADRIVPTDDPDQDLLNVVVRLQRDTGGYVNLYQPPYVDHWKRPVKAQQRAWLVRPRQPQSGATDLMERWTTEGFVSLAATHLGLVEPGADRGTVRDAVEEGYRHVDYAQQLQLATEYHAFLSRMAPDDFVVMVANDLVWAGTITGDATYLDDDAGRLRRPVDWYGSPLAVGQVPAALSSGIEQQGVVVDLTGSIDAVVAMTSLLDEWREEDLAEFVAAQPPQTSLTFAKATDGFAADLHMSREWLQERLDVLEDRQQIIFYGPPGTGKTFLAQALGRHITSPDAVQIVQLHPSFTYEDFFEGYRPYSTDDERVLFKLQPGPLRRLAAAARDDPSRPYVLIIDEINRGNLAKVFGELYFLLEYRDENVRLQYSPDSRFSLPRNVFIIGTMNTSDRSIALVDAAIRRRFAFIELHPGEPPVRDVLRTWLSATDRDALRADLLDALNEAIGEEDREFMIGPSYLMTPDVDRDGGLERVWRYSILPLLEEQYFDRLNRQDVHARFGLDAIRSRAG